MIDFDFVLKTHKKYKDISIEEEITLEQIKEKLNLLLNGDKYNYSYYIELRDAFLIQYNLSNIKIYKTIYENLYYIFSNFNFENKFSNDKDNFINAYKYCLHARQNNFFSPTHIYISDNIKCLCESLIFFKEKGFSNFFNNGKVNFKKILEIEKTIDNKFKNIGISSIPFIFAKINKLFDTKFYLFITEHDKQIYPWGYILNKAIKHSTSIPLTKNVLQIRLDSALEFSKHYISLYQYQNYPLSHLKYTTSSPESILKTIDNHVIGDQLLKIEQYDPKSILDYLNFINNKFKTPEFNLTLELASFIYTKPHNEIVDITEEIDIIYKKYPIDISNKISKLVNHTCINNKFHTLYDLDKADYKKKPFVKILDKIFFLNHSFFYIGFYYVFLELLYQIGIKSNEQGLILEDFAEYSLKSTSQKFIGNNEYDVKGPQRTAMGIASESLELDLAIHNQKSIALFEIKHRVLTDSSKGGNGYNILNDLSESLIKSQTQLNKHKRFLLNFKEINFRDGQKLLLDNRTIYKISISSLEYQSLHYPLIAQNFLRALPFFSINLTSNPKTNELVKNINKKIKAFSDDILKPETKNEIDDPHGLHNSYFINIFHFLFLIERAKSKGTDFIDELTIYHNTILNQLDFYYCYFYKDRKFKN